MAHVLGSATHVNPSNGPLVIRDAFADITQEDHVIVSDDYYMTLMGKVTIPKNQVNVDE